MAGSSPRVRGTRRSCSRPCRSARFIPACAGNSPDTGGCWRRSAVHPRVCGELLASSFVDAHAAGSSPRVRGTLHVLRPRGLHRRFIPACAGNSIGRSLLPSFGPVHPRVCGELQRRQLADRPDPGSSPRVRGTHPPPALGRVQRRFIPACAGNSGRAFSDCRGPPVHPRVCGELLQAQRRDRRHCGSSPRVRGTRAAPTSAAGCDRFIPACAGNSSRRAPPAPCNPVHPRVCGELLESVVAGAGAGGSSPRVRGTLDGLGAQHAGLRFIPACAGNSHAARRRANCRTVHPRVCGELGPPSPTRG